ncbi:MAG: hypothetical protein KME42_15615 [Tildeniella nuda ZEHNDER 1965/U140]|jgi:hypothetical protein|nr:hypothetical protein [Tildeniella nuda ZEHNDER 1965/U140]
MNRRLDWSKIQRQTLTPNVEQWLNAEVSVRTLSATYNFEYVVTAPYRQFVQRLTRSQHALSPLLRHVSG